MGFIALRASPIGEPSDWGPPEGPKSYQIRLNSYYRLGEMGRWGDGEMGRWGDGEMGRWGVGGDGEIY